MKSTESLSGYELVNTATSILFGFLMYIFRNLIMLLISNTLNGEGSRTSIC